MFAPIQHQPSVVPRAAEAALFKPGQVLEALVMSKAPDGMATLRIGDFVLKAQLPQTLPAGTTLHLQVRIGGPLPQLVMVGTPQLSATTVLVQPAPVLPLPAVLVSPASAAGPGWGPQMPARSPAATPPLTAKVAGAPGAVSEASAPASSNIARPIAVSRSAQPQPAPTPAPVSGPQMPTPIRESRQPVAATGARIESSPRSMPVSAASTASSSPLNVQSGSPAVVATQSSTQPQTAIISAAAAELTASTGPAPRPVASVTLSAQAQWSAVSPNTGGVSQVTTPAGVLPPAAIGAAGRSATPAAGGPPAALTGGAATAATAQAQTLGPPSPGASAMAVGVTREPVAPNPLLVAQGVARQPLSLADLPRPAQIAAGTPIQPLPLPATPAAALAQMIPGAMARQNSIAPLIASLASMVARPGALPEPVLRAALQVLGARMQIPPNGPTGQMIETAVAKSGVYLEATLAKGTPPSADLKAGLVALKGALAAWLGANPAPVMAVQRVAPPLRGVPPRVEVVASQPLPEAPREAARLMHSQADAALSRVKLMQLASLPDADPIRTMPQELRTEVPFLVGQELVMAQFQVFRDGARRKSEGKRGWTMRFAINSAVTGEVGAEIGLLGRAVNVALWAAEPGTAADLAAALPGLGPALVSLGLEPGTIRVRSLPPEVPRAASGQYLDSSR